MTSRRCRHPASALPALHFRLQDTACRCNWWCIHMSTLLMSGGAEWGGSGAGLVAARRDPPLQVRVRACHGEAGSGSLGHVQASRAHWWRCLQATLGPGPLYSTHVLAVRR